VFEEPPGVPPEHLGRDVADVPLIAIAREAGMSQQHAGCDD